MKKTVAASTDRTAAWLEDAANDRLTSASPGDQHNFRVAAAQLRAITSASVKVAERLEAWAATHDNLAKRESDAERAKVQTHKRYHYRFLSHLLRQACGVDSSADSAKPQGPQVSSPAASHHKDWCALNQDDHTRECDCR